MTRLMQLTACLVVAHVRSNNVTASELLALILAIHNGLTAPLGGRSEVPTATSSSKRSARPFKKSKSAKVELAKYTGRRRAAIDLVPSSGEVKEDQLPASPAHENAVERLADAPGSSSDKSGGGVVFTQAGREGAQPRKRLSVRLGAPSPCDDSLVEGRDRNLGAVVSADVAGKRDLLVLAITTSRCVHWLYNRTPMLAAPYILYVERGELYVDAAALEKNGAPAREKKIGRFKLSGLSAISLTAVAIRAGDAPDRLADRYAGGIVAAVDAGGASRRRALMQPDPPAATRSR